MNTIHDYNTIYRILIEITITYDCYIALRQLFILSKLTFLWNFQRFQSISLSFYILVTGDCFVN